MNGKYTNTFEKDGYRKESAIHFINSLLVEKGKKVKNIENLNKTNQMTTKYKLDVENRSFREQLNPNNPIYTKSESSPQLSHEQQAKRMEFVNELIKTYLMIETDRMYDERVEHEDSNMKFAVKKSQDIHLTKIDIPKIMRLLLAAKNVSLYGQKDFLEEIISQPSMNQALLTIKKSPEYIKMVERREEKKKTGKLINGKPQGHRETIGERDSRIANSLISKYPDSINVAKQKLSLGSQLKFKDERNAIFYSAVARTLGKQPSYNKDKNGNFEFDSGEGISR